MLQTFITAYLELIMLGQLKKGQSVLIHAGASGVGEGHMLCGVPAESLPSTSTLLHVATAWPSLQARLIQSCMAVGRAFRSSRNLLAELLSLDVHHLDTPSPVPSQLCNSWHLLNTSSCQHRVPQPHCLAIT